MLSTRSRGEAVTSSFGVDSKLFLADPYPCYATMRREAPVHEALQPSGLRTWLVTRYEDAIAALADPRLLKDLRHADPRHFAGYQGAASLGPNMLTADPPEHTRLRRLVARALTERRVKAMAARIGDIAGRLLDDMNGLHRVDLIDSYASPLPLTVLCELLGIPVEHRASIRSWTTAAMLTPPLTPEQRAAGEQAVEAMRRYAEGLAAERWSERAGAGTEEDQPHLLGALAAARDRGVRLSGNELVSMIMLLLVVGHETTVGLIGNGMLALLRHPDQLERLKEQPQLLPRAVQELLRYNGPAQQATLRVAAENVEIGGVSVPEGSLVSVVIASADRDPQRFRDPDRLDVGRTDNGHIAFGHGIHFCVGARLANLEAEIAIGMLLDRFPGIALIGEPGQLRWRRSFMRGLLSLPVRLDG